MQSSRSSYGRTSINRIVTIIHSLDHQKPWLSKVSIIQTPIVWLANGVHSSFLKIPVNIRNLEYSFLMIYLKNDNFY